MGTDEHGKLPRAKLQLRSSSEITQRPQGWLVEPRIRRDDARSHQVLIVDPAVPAKSVQELVAYAKGNPGKVHFGSPGFGTGMVANLPHDHRVAVLEERVAALEQRVGLVAAQDRINLRSPVDDSKISEVIR
jgi:hypothetical protein